MTDLAEPLPGVAAARIPHPATGYLLYLAAALLFVFVALTRRSALRLRRSELPMLAVYGVLGITGTQFLYFLAIERMPIGVTLLVEFTAPLMLALWFRFGLGHPTRPTVWAALVAALVGLAVVAQVWEGFTLDAFGVVAATHLQPGTATSITPSTIRTG